MTELTDGSIAQHTITVHLVVRGADRAANWYVQALRSEGAFPSRTAGSCRSSSASATPP
jgi:hypothetical protein